MRRLVIIDPRWKKPVKAINPERHLLHVARTRDFLLATDVTPTSEFLKDLDPKLGRRHQAHA